jgi:hypothetical protein
MPLTRTQRKEALKYVLLTVMDQSEDGPVMRALADASTEVVDDLMGLSDIGIDNLSYVKTGETNRTNLGPTQQGLVRAFCAYMRYRAKTSTPIGDTWTSITKQEFDDFRISDFYNGTVLFGQASAVIYGNSFRYAAAAYASATTAAAATSTPIATADASATTAAPPTPTKSATVSAAASATETAAASATETAPTTANAKPTPTVATISAAASATETIAATRTPIATADAYATTAAAPTPTKSATVSAAASATETAPTTANEKPTPTVATFSNPVATIRIMNRDELLVATETLLQKIPLAVPKLHPLTTKHESCGDRPGFDSPPFSRFKKLAVDPLRGETRNKEYHRMSLMMRCVEAAVGYNSNALTKYDHTGRPPGESKNVTITDYCGLQRSPRWRLVSDDSETLWSLARHHLLPFGNCDVLYFYDPSLIKRMGTDNKHIRIESRRLLMTRLKLVTVFLGSLSARQCSFAIDRLLERMGTDKKNTRIGSRKLLVTRVIF